MKLLLLGLSVWSVSAFAPLPRLCGLRVDATPAREFHVLEAKRDDRLIREYKPAEGYKTLVPNLLLFFTVLQLPELLLRIPQYSACVADKGRAYQTRLVADVAHRGRGLT